MMNETGKTKLSKGAEVMVRRVDGSTVNGYTYRTMKCRITRVFGTCYEVEAVNGEPVLPNKISRISNDWWWGA